MLITHLHISSRTTSPHDAPIYQIMPPSTSYPELAWFSWVLDHHFGTLQIHIGTHIFLVPWMWRSHHSYHQTIDLYQQWVQDIPPSIHHPQLTPTCSLTSLPIPHPTSWAYSTAIHRICMTSPACIWSGVAGIPGSCFRAYPTPQLIRWLEQEGSAVWWLTMICHNSP